MRKLRFHLLSFVLGCFEEPRNEQAVRTVHLRAFCRVLLKEPRGKDVGDEDVFTFNAAYTSRLYR